MKRSAEQGTMASAFVLMHLFLKHSLLTSNPTQIVREALWQSGCAWLCGYTSYTYRCSDKQKNTRQEHRNACLHEHTRIHIRTYIYAHTHVHMHIHTNTCTHRSGRTSRPLQTEIRTKPSSSSSRSSRSSSMEY